jgi:hypothetical protein
MEEKADLEKVIRAYLSLGNANAVMYVIKALEKADITDYEQEMEKYIYTPSDIMDDSERSLSTLGIAKKYGIILLNYLGVIIDNDYVEDLSMTTLAAIIENLLTVEELDISDSLNILSFINEVEDDRMFFIRFLLLDETIDYSSILDSIKDVSPTLVSSIKEVVTSNIEEEGIVPIDLRNEDTNKACDVLEYLKNNLEVTTPDEIVMCLLNKDYRDGLNDEYIKDIIKPIRLNIERYEGDKKFKYLLSIAAQLLFIYTINKEDEPILMSFDAVHDYLDPSTVTEMNRNLIKIDSIYKDSGLYDIEKGSNYE